MPDLDHPASEPSESAGPSTNRASDGPAPAAPNGPADTPGEGALAAPGGGAPEIPDSELPPLSFPNSEQYRFRQLAEQRRKVRIRNEAIFGVIMLVVGLLFVVIAHNVAFMVIALISGVALVAYEMTVATLE